MLIHFNVEKKLYEISKRVCDVDLAIRQALGAKFNDIPLGMISIIFTTSDGIACKGTVAVC
jgi:hypothetical protein